MTNVVIKRSVMVDQGQGNTDQIAATGDQSPVLVTLSNGQNLAWGPNESKTLVEPFATEALNFDNRLVEVSRS